jgi:HSP20 family protein
LVVPALGLRREIDRLFEDTIGMDAWGRHGTAWAPSVDVREDDHELVLSLELPGVKPSDVEITAENGVLTIRGEKHEMRKEGDEGTRYHVVERSYGGFARSFQMPKGLDEANIAAEYTNGVLTIHVPKTALAQPRRIAIKSPESGSANGGSQTAEVKKPSK